MTFQGVRPPKKLIWEIIVALLYKHLQDRIELHVPLKTVKQTGESCEPWFTRELDLLNK